MLSHRRSTTVSLETYPPPPFIQDINSLHLSFVKLGVRNSFKNGEILLQIQRQVSEGGSHHSRFSLQLSFYYECYKKYIARRRNF